MDFAIDLVGGADRHLVETRENVELREHEIGETVDAHGVANHEGVVPAATARSPRIDAHFVALLLKVFAPFIEEFRGERASAHARRVRLDDADRAVDARRADTGTRARATRGGVRARHERVRAVVHVEVGRLAALHEHEFPPVERRVQHLGRVHDHGADPLRVLEKACHDFLNLYGPTVVELHEHAILLAKRAFNLLAQDRLVE